MTDCSVASNSPSPFASRKTVFPSAGDEISGDNVAISREFQVTDRTFAVDDDNFIGSLGVPGPGLIRQGQQINFEKSDEIHSVSVNVLGGFSGDTIWAEVYSIDSQTNEPDSLLSTSRKNHCVIMGNA